MNEFKLKNIIDRYLSGNANEQEREFIDCWYENVENEDGIPSSPNEDLKNKLFLNINRELNSRGAGMTKNGINLSWLLKAAAIFFLAMISVFFYYSYQKSNEWITFSTRKDATRKIVLADSSVVWLNTASSLKYTDKFNSDKREIWLNGEAYFDIKHNQNKPFLVHTNELTTSVLGTAFNINAYHKSREVIVTVTRGKVGLLVTGSPNPMFFTANQEGIYNAKKQMISKSQVNANKSNAWVFGDLVFKEMRFIEIVERLESRFGVSIGFSSNELKNCILTASFRKDASISEILDILCQIDRCAFTIDPKINKYLITGKGCN